MKKVILFGACGEAAFAIAALEEEKREVEYFVDNNRTKHGKKNWLGKKVLNFEEYLEIKDDYELIVTVANPKYREEIAKQLKENGITDWKLFHKGNWKDKYKKERIISYCQTVSMEDVILYHVCHDMDQIFYIDVGSNDPYIESVTKTLYDMKNAHGINIEPQEELIFRTNLERPRDVNICAAVGEKEGEMELWIQGGGSTFRKEYASENGYKKMVPIVTLKSICEQYLQECQEITFLKIDVEGYEKNVLLGADFTRFRPSILLLEATKPGTFEWCYDEWEYILLENHYHPVYEYGINRWYVADEHRELDERFIPMEEIMKKYYVCKAIIDMN